MPSTPIQSGGVALWEIWCLKLLSEAVNGGILHHNRLSSAGGGGDTVMVVKCLHRLHRGAEQRESTVLGGKRRGGRQRMKAPLCL